MSILEIIKQIEEDKISRKIVPSHAVLTEVLRETNKQGIDREIVLSELNNLWKLKKIKTGPTINDKYIQTV
nr:MAG TPA: hypothetical protein [Caudoviricetes sp.]